MGERVVQRSAGRFAGTKAGQWRCHLMRSRCCLQGSSSSKDRFLGESRDGRER